MKVIATMCVMSMAAAVCSAQTQEQTAQYQLALTIKFQHDVCVAWGDCNANSFAADMAFVDAMNARPGCTNLVWRAEGDALVANGNQFYTVSDTLRSQAAVLLYAGDAFFATAQTQWAAGDFNIAITSALLARGKYADALTKFDAASGGFATAKLLYQLARDKYKTPVFA